MQGDWRTASIRSYLYTEFSGEWGATPGDVAANALVLRSTNLDDDGHVDRTGGAPRVIPKNKLANKQLRDGDVLLEASGGGPGKPVGRVALFQNDGNGPYLCSNFFRTLRPAKSCDPHFLAWRLLHLYQQPAIWTYQQQTTGIINLKYRDYLAHNLDFPPLRQQRHIAEILDTLDEAIRKTEQVIAKLQQMKQGLLHDLLTRGIDENGELRDPERHPEQFKDSPLGRIPKVWEVLPLEELVTAPICYGIVQAGPFFADGVEVLMIRDVRGDFRSNLHRTRPSIDGRYARSRVVPRDLLLSIKGTIGRVGVVPSHFSGNISRDLARIRLMGSVIPEFAQQYLLSPGGQHRLTLSVVGTTRAEIAIHVLKQLLLPVPSTAEQELISGSLTYIEDRLKQEQRQIEKTRSTKHGLMDDLLTGRIRVSLPEDAAA